MIFKQIFEHPRRVLSFELFPPKTSRGETALYGHVEKLTAFKPDFITCTYGAGGSTRHKTLEIVVEIKKRFNSIVASHLTVVDSTVDQLRAYLSQATDANIDAIVALRGDPPQGSDQFVAADDGLAYANELVDLIRQEFSHFSVAVAGYPETHREAPSPQTDLDNLKRKVDSGADLIITQLFYDNADFFRFRERCQAAGINVPILPGILPITKMEQAQRITSLCGAKFPEALAGKLGQRNDENWHFQVGVEHATRQVDELVEAGVDGVHFYVLNRSQAVVAIMSALQNEFQSAGC